MKRFLLLIPVCIFFVGCTSTPSTPDYSNTKPGYYGGDGSSQEQAVICVGVDESPYAWIAQKYPGSKILDQALSIPPGGKRYDVFRVQKRDGTVIKAWFLAGGGIDALIH
jgi:hypothetical protein